MAKNELTSDKIRKLVAKLTNSEGVINIVEVRKARGSIQRACGLKL
jgi:hypothetical protein